MGCGLLSYLMWQLIPFLDGCQFLEPCIKAQVFHFKHPIYRSQLWSLKLYHMRYLDADIMSPQSFFPIIVLVPRASITNYHNLGFGGWRSEIKVLAGPRSFWRLYGRSFPCLFLAAGGSWQSLACSCVTPVTASVFKRLSSLRCLCVFTWPSYKDTSQWF